MVRLPRTARHVLGRVRPPRQVFPRGAPLAHAAPALTITERQHIERVLGAGRVALCTAALLALASDPMWNGSPGRVAGALLAGYLLVGVAQLAASWTRAWLVPSEIAHAADFCAAAALTMATAPLPSSPFFLLFLFALLGAAYRWGLRAALGTAGFAVLVLSTQYVVGGMELQPLLMRSACLVIAACLVGGLAQVELQRRGKSAVITGALARLHSGTSVHAAMRETSASVLALVGGERLVAAVHDPGTGASYVWTAYVHRSRTRVTVREIGAQERGRYFFSAPGDTWQARRSARGMMRAACAPGGGGHAPQDRACTIPDAIWQNSPVDSVAVVEVTVAGQWSGRVFLLRSRPLRASELAFLREVIGQVAPAIFSLYLLRRLRARVSAAERARVARELHDGVIQALAGLRFDVAALRRHADRGMRIEAELARLEHVLAEQTIAARELMHRVRPVDVTPAQLPGYLGAMVERFTRETGIPAHYHTDVEETDLPPRVCRELSRTLQEALVNVRKHSAARHVVVRFSADPIHYRLTIDNDGRPFEFAGRLTLAELEAARRGPLVIKERVREMGGELVIESSVERGVRLDILLRRRLRAGSTKTA